MEEIDLGISRARYWDSDNRRVAIVLPGARYFPTYPLLWFAREAIAACGWSVLELWYEWSPSDGEPEPWVHARLQAALDKVSRAERPLLVGKSLGSLAADMAAEKELPAIWLTPLLELPSVRSAIGRSPAAVLLAGGTADKSWVADAVEELRAKGAAVVEVAGADHSLEVPGDLPATLDALAEVTRAISSFVETVR